MHLARRFAGTCSIALLAALATGCERSTTGIDGGDASVAPGVPRVPLEALDLLIVVDNSASMRENQETFLAQTRALYEALTQPPDRDGDGRPDHRAVRDLHLGVISPDLGSPRATLRGCDHSDLGDDGLLNPLRYGLAMQRHRPWTVAPAGFRPDDCNTTDQFPSFITLTAGMTDLDTFVHDATCNTALYVNGCGIEPPLEAAWRALGFHGAASPPGSMARNGGFLRENAVLAIVMLTDEEDGSARDCRYAEPGVACVDGLSVFDSTSTGWSASNLNMRSYMYQPCSAQDPNWNLDRYFDPRDPRRGFLSLKPGHPERIVFAAITGVPLRAPPAPLGAHADWDALLGPRGPGGADDFCGRAGAQGFNDATNPEGPVSMRQANRDPNPNCTDRVVPACRREGSAYDPANPPCSPTEQYFAWPARRVVELARRFDETPVCDGAPCRNGLVASICANDYRASVDAIVARIQQRLEP